MNNNEYAFIEYVPDPRVYPTYESLPDYTNWMKPEGILGYRLVDHLGNMIDVPTKDCKRAFDNGDIRIVNLNKINETNSVQRSASFKGVFPIVNNFPDTVDAASKAKIDSILKKAKAHGMEIIIKNKIRTGCGHFCTAYLIKHQDGIVDAIIEVPDNVFFLNLSERPMLFSNRIRTFNLNGTVKFVGGANLRHCIYMFMFLNDCKIDLSDFNVFNKQSLQQNHWSFRKVRVSNSQF